MISIRRGYIDADAGERAAVWPLEELTLADRARLAEMSLVVAIGVGQTIILEGDRPEALCVMLREARASRCKDVRSREHLLVATI